MNRATTAIGALGALALAAPGAASAQRIEVTVHAQAATFRTAAAGLVEEASTANPGGGIALWLGNLRLGVEGAFGDANSKSPGGFKVRTTTLSAGVRALPFEFGVEAAARHRTSNAGATTSLVRLAGPYGRAIADFGAGFSGQATLALYPVRRAVNADPLSVAMRAEIGARYTPRSGPLSFFTSYRLLRLDYRPVQGDQRLEQDAGMFVGVTYVTGREQ